jgi:FixJ family two-component response regulator
MLHVDASRGTAARRAVTVRREPVVFVVDDDAGVRTGIARLVRSAGFEVSVFGSAREYLAAHDDSQPGCLVLDLEMPGMDGLAVQEVLRAAGRGPPIVFLTAHGNVAASVLAMKHGAVDFLGKPVDERTLLEAVATALALDHSARAARDEVALVRSRLATLTPRETEVLRMIVAGKANKVIAIELGTVEQTVKVHRGRVTRKMQVRSLAALVQCALRVGIC